MIAVLLLFATLLAMYVATLGADWLDLGENGALALGLIPLILYLVALGWNDLRKACQTSRGRCTECGYNRAGLGAHAPCPECGAKP